MVVASSGGWVLVQLGAMLLGLLGLAVVLRRRLDGAGRSQAVRSIRLSPEHALHVVELGGRTLIVGTGPGGPPAVLQTLDRADEAATQMPSQAPRRGWDSSEQSERADR